MTALSTAPRRARLRTARARRLHLTSFSRFTPSRHARPYCRTRILRAPPLTAARTLLCSYCCALCAALRTSPPHLAYARARTSLCLFTFTPRALHRTLCARTPHAAPRGTRCALHLFFVSSFLYALGHAPSQHAHCRALRTASAALPPPVRCCALRAYCAPPSCAARAAAAFLHSAIIFRA